MFGLLQRLDSYPARSGVLGGIAVSAVIEKRLNDGGVPAFINQFRTDFEARKQRDLAEANARMPRTTKLSTLQKQILVLALRWQGKSHDDVYVHDIKTEVFGWKPMQHYSTGWYDEAHAQPGTARHELDHFLANRSLCGQVFDRESIGTAKYSSVSVSISRALKRLTARHLLYLGCDKGWSLTEHGEEVAKTIAMASES